MRASAIVLVLITLAAPAASAWVVPAPTARDVANLAARAFDPTDAQLLALLGAEIGLAPARVVAPAPGAGDSVGAAAMRLARIAGAELSPADAARLNTLDARLAAPTLTLLVAMEAAWTSQHAMLAEIPPAKLAAAMRANEQGLPLVEPLLTPDQQELLLANAIMLMDTLESVVVPALQALPPEAWPPVAVADPVGVVFIGSNGADVDTLERALSLDGGGDDQYFANRGGASPDTNPTTPDFVAAISIDLRGDDTYQQSSMVRFSFGSGFAGTGILLDHQGDDEYSCQQFCLGHGSAGIGYLRDFAGADSYTGYYQSQGSVSIGILGIGREDAGEDTSMNGGDNMGNGQTEGLGLWWDRQGADEHLVPFPFTQNYGFAQGDSKGWFVSDGPEIDTYRSLNQDHLTQRRCNDCVWVDGAGGRGNDNFGGLPFLLSHQDAL